MNDRRNGGGVRFGVYEVDLRSGELRKAGTRLALQDQPFRILARLLECPGELITRDELRAELWPADTFVDFEHGLNAAVKRLRDVLGDSAETPRFIETIHRRGYRFIAPVDRPATPVSPHVPVPHPIHLRKGSVIAGIAVLVASVAGVVSTAVWRARSVPPGEAGSRTISPPEVHTIIEAPPSAPFALGAVIPDKGFDSTTIALSPDGRQLAYVGHADGTTQLFVRPATSVQVRAVPGTEGAIFPFFSPDGRWLGFLTNDKVKKVLIEGGSPVTLCETINPVAAWWRADDSIFFTFRLGSWLGRVDGDGGSPQVVLSSDRRTLISDVLPDGKWALASVPPGGVSHDHSALMLVSLEGRGRRAFGRGGFRPMYAPPDRIVFAHGGDLLAVRFNPVTLDVSNERGLVASNVAMSTLWGSVQAAVSASGLLAYLSGGDHSKARLAWVDKVGRTEFLRVPAQVYADLDLSPDGSHVALHVTEATDYILIQPLRSGQPLKLASTQHQGWPVWSPDGKHVVVSSWLELAGSSTLVLRSIDDPTVSRDLLTSPRRPIANSWRPDGGRIAFEERAKDGRLGFARLDAPPEWSISRDLGWGLYFSPDGRWTAYTRAERNRVEVFVQSYPDRQRARQVSIDGGREPLWCRCGELFFRQGRRWMSVTIKGNPLSVSSPQLAFDTDFVDTPGLSYDVSPDGRRLLVLKRVNEGVPPQLHLIINWRESLR